MRLALLLLLIPSLAFAQSDNRKLAVFLTMNNGNLGAHQGTGDLLAGDGAGMTLANSALFEALHRMGVPYDVYSFTDSSRWGEGGKADSTWFREQGYFGIAYCHGTATTSSSFQMHRFFVNEAGTRSFAASPAGGTWGIPAVAFIGDGVTNNSDFVNGAHSVSFAGVDVASKSAFGNGDSLEYHSRPHVKDPDDLSDITVILAAGDTLSGDPDEPGSMMKAWRYKDAMYYYVRGNASPTSLNANPVPLLLGLNQLFEDAGYTPRQKLRYHLTVDHPFPLSVRSAPSDSFWAYVNQGRWNVTGAYKAHKNERDTYDDLDAGAPWITNKAAWRAHPHSHEAGVGSYTLNDNYDLTGFSDTTQLYQRWNDMEEAIADTSDLTLAKGYEKVAMLPGGGMADIQAYGLPQAGYVAMRASFEDSIGHESTNRRMGYEDLEKTPYLYVEPKTGKSIWVVGNLTHPGSNDTTWAQVPGQFVGTIPYTRIAKHVGDASRTMLYSADHIWHGEENLEGPDDPLTLMSRRMLYLLGRTGRVVESSFSFQPRVPRRHNMSTAAP